MAIVAYLLVPDEGWELFSVMSKHLKKPAEDAKKQSTTSDVARAEKAKWAHDWIRRREFAHLICAHEFIRTGRTEERDVAIGKLNEESWRNSGARKESPSQRWGLDDPEIFDVICRNYDADARACGEAEGEGEIKWVLITARCLLEGLLRLANNGSPCAVAAVCELACQGTSFTELLMKERSELVRGFAEKCVSFPILISKHSDRSGTSYIRERLDALNIGDRAAINASGFAMRPSRRQPFKAALHEMCERLFAVVDGVRKQLHIGLHSELPQWFERATELPALTERTSRSLALNWFEVAWAALCAATDERPEKLPLLRKLGVYKRTVVKESIRKSKFSSEEQRAVYDRLRGAWLARFSRKV